MCDVCRHAHSLGAKSPVRATRCFADRLDAIANPMATEVRSQPPLSSRLAGDLEYAYHVIRYSSEEFRYIFAQSNACEMDALSRWIENIFSSLA
jgi:hypothetical protein